MYKRFKWTPESAPRNSLTMRYEPIQPFLFVALAELNASKVVFDIGANIGVYALFSTAIPDIREIYAYEVDHTAFRNLSENIRVNSAQEVIFPKQTAVSGYSGEIEFSFNAPMAGINAVRETSFHDPKHYSEFRQVPCVALDDDFSMDGEHISLKIDVEGHEIEVLEGASALLKNNACVVQTEVYKTLEPTRALLQNLGYRKIFAAHHDHYYSNSMALLNCSTILGAMELAVTKLISHNLES